MELITAERLPGFGCSFPGAIVWVGLVVAPMKGDICQIPLGLGKTRDKKNGAFCPGARAVSSGCPNMRWDKRVASSLGLPPLQWHEIDVAHLSASASRMKS